MGQQTVGRFFASRTSSELTCEASTARSNHSTGPDRGFIRRSNQYHTTGILKAVVFATNGKGNRRWCGSGEGGGGHVHGLC